MHVCAIRVSDLGSVSKSSKGIVFHVSVTAACTVAFPTAANVVCSLVISC